MTASLDILSLACYHFFTFRHVEMLEGLEALTATNRQGFALSATLGSVAVYIGNQRKAQAVAIIRS